MKQKPVCNGYFVVPELDDVLKSGCYEPLLAYDNVDWFVDEVINLEKETVFFKKH